MGLVPEIMKFIVNEHLRKPLLPKILSLGRQNIYATLDEAITLMQALGHTPHNIIYDTSIHTAIPGHDKKYISDTTFFKMLAGPDILLEALDISDFEGADIVHNMNFPIPEAMRGKYSFIIDAGTSEHVFNLPQSLNNISDMLETGGRVMHILPCNQYVNHGFYQFSPTTFFDYYATNGFSDVRVTTVAHSTENIFSQLIPLEIIPVSERIVTPAEYSLTQIVTAVKTQVSTNSQSPVQSEYIQHDADAPAVQHCAVTLKQAVGNIRQGNFDAAHAIMQTIGQPYADDPSVKYYRAVCLNALGNYDMAAGIIRELLSDHDLPPVLIDTASSFADGKTGYLWDSRKMPFTKKAVRKLFKLSNHAIYRWING